jgi:hypothetical protein
MDRFEEALAPIKAQGSTLLYKAIDQAVRDLVTDVAPDGPGASLAHARRRIVVLSDGEDSDWARMPAARVDPIALTQFLINNKIVIDGNAPYRRSANSRAALRSGRGRERRAFAFRAGGVPEYHGLTDSPGLSSAYHEGYVHRQKPAIHS